MSRRCALLALAGAGACACSPSRPSVQGIVRVAVSRSGRYLAVADSAGRVRVHDSGSRGSSEFDVAAGPVNDLRFSPDESTLAIAAREMWLWRHRSASAARALTQGSPNYGSAAFLPSGVALATVTGRGVLEMLETASGKVLWSQCCTSIYGDAAVDPRGFRVVTAGHWPRVWEARTGRLLGPLVSERSEPAFGPAAFSPDGRNLWIGCQDGVLRQWEAASLTLLQSLPAQPGWIESIALPPSGDAVAFTVRSRGIFLWNGSIQRLQADTPSSNIVFDASGSRLLAGTADGRLAWLEMGTGEREAVDLMRR